MTIAMSRPPATSAFTPRPYQDAAFAAIRGKFLGGDKSTLLILPTGMGKTLVFGMVARWATEDLGGRVLVLAHRDVLIKQAVDKLERVGIPCAVEKADQDAWETMGRDEGSSFGRGIRCVVASVQSLHAKRLMKRPRDYFKVIVTDEAHHATCDTYTRIYRHFSSAWHLGVTATGDRVDGDNLGRVFASKAFEMRLDEGIKLRWLAPVVVAQCDQKVDLRGISVVAGDFNRGELEDRISRNIEPLVAGAKAKIGSRQTVVFCPYVLSARAFADGLRQVGINARAVWGEAYDREETLSGFHEGEFQVLVNVGIATEGWDEPAVSAVVLARPTKSKNLLTQMIGRGTRLYDGKEDCLVIDYDWQVDEHKGDICKPVHLVAPEGAGADVLSFADALVESGFQPDVMKAVEEAQAQKAEVVARQEAKAKEELRARQEREKLRIAVRDRESRLTWTHSSLVGMSAADVPRVRPRDELPGRSRATSAQVAVLMRHGVSEAEAVGMTEREATENILSLNRREDEGMATLRQVGRLMSEGWTRERAWRLTKGEASWEIDMASRRGNASA